MTLIDLENAVLFQTNNDIDDLTDYIPHLPDYINEGYDRLVFAFAKAHVKTGDADYPPLSSTSDVPNLPEWSHVGIRDYATYLMYRNGNPSKQQRGMAYYQAFLEVEKQLKFDISKRDKRHFFNLYAERSDD